MKKLLLSLFAAGSLFAANAQTQANPYSVLDYISACGNGALGTEVYVQGYIVGWVNGASISGATFTVPATAYSNVLIAESQDEVDYNYCVPVQLVSGTDLRSAVNLGDHPENLGHEIVIGGSSEKYFGMEAAIKAPTYYKWVGDAPVATTPDVATGSKEKPLSVTEFLAEGTPSSAVAATYVKGVIVGYVPGMTYSEGVFGATGEVSATNVLIAETADVTNLDNCIPVQLPSGTIRETLNLLDNPGNIGKTVILAGSHEKYFGTNGLKSVTWAELDGTEVGTTPSTPTTPSDALYSGLTANADDWTFEGTVPEGISYVWAWDAQYGLKASAYVSGVRYEVNDFIAVSPVIDLTGVTDAKLAFSQAANYCNGKYAEFCVTKVREEGGAWENLTVNNCPEGNNWTFVDSDASLDAYAGKKIQIGFSYSSTATDAATWEIKSLTVTSTSGVATVEADAVVYVLGNNIVAPEGAKVYNLNGVQTGTQNLANGVYVVVAGQKAVKVLVK